MRRWVLSGVLVVAVITFSFSQEHDLRILNNKERISYALNGQFPNAKTIYRDSTGSALRINSILFPVVGNELYGGSDYYVNASGKIMEVVLRKANAGDQALNKKLFDIEEDQLRGSMEPAKILCSHERELLAEVLAKDKENRKNEQVIDAELDNTLEATVVGILQQCGAPELDVVGADGIRAVYNVMMHARRKNQDKYRFVLEDFIKKGNLRKGATAAIEDRLRMARGEKQLYGTQIVFFAKTGYELFPIADPDNVDQRRAAAGLPSLEEYLKTREEFFGAEIKR